MKILSEPPWVVEIDGIKFATPEAVVLLLKAVSEERDTLEAKLKAENLAKSDAWEKLDYFEAQLASLREPLGKLKHHLGTEGEYCITRADKRPMSWESLGLSGLFLEIDEFLDA